MSEADNSDPPKVDDQPSMSQLSANAACFVPTNFEQTVIPTSHEMSSYFDGYVWQGSEIKGASPYVRHIEQWPLGNPFANAGIQPPFHYGQYPPVGIDYFPVSLRSEGLTSRTVDASRLPDAFNSPYTDLSWNNSLLQEPTVPNILSTRQPKSNKVKDSCHSYSEQTDSLGASKDGGHLPAAVASEGGEPIRTKKKKKKSRSIIRIEKGADAKQDTGGQANGEECSCAQSKDGKNGKSEEQGGDNMQTSSSTSLKFVGNPSPQAGRKLYKDNDAQTDFSEELSRLTLSEKPSLLYDHPVTRDFLKNYIFSGTSAAIATSSTATVSSKPLLWATVVSQTALHSSGKTSSSETSVPFNPNLKSQSNQLSHSGVDLESKKLSKNEKKSGFDHSFVRSPSGKRKSTGISTSDQKRDHSSSGKAKPDYSSEKHEYSSEKHEYSSKKHEYSSEKQKDSSKKHLTIVSGGNQKGQESSVAETKFKVSADEKRGQSEMEISKLQRVSKNNQDEFLGKAKSQKTVKKENATKTERSLTLSAKRYEESSLRSGTSRSPSFRRSQTVGSSSRSKTSAASELSRSASSGRHLATTGGTPSPKNEAGAAEDNWQQSKSRKTNKLQVDDSKQSAAMLVVKPEVKQEGTNKRRRKHRKKKTGAKEDGEIGEKDSVVKSNVLLPSSLSVGPSIKFDDDDEFPGLLNAARESLNELSSGPIKYSDVLSGRVKTPSRSFVSNRQNTATKENKEGILDEEDKSLDFDFDAKKESLQTPLQKPVNARSFSQPPKSKTRPTPEKRALGAGTKTKEPITLSLFDMITVKTKNKKTPEKDEGKKPLKTGAKSLKLQESKSGNVLDSSGVHVRRGKEREAPKPKKPSLLRKVILKERESRRQKFLQECMRTNDEETAATSDLTEDFCDGALRRHASAPMRTSVPRVASVSPTAARADSSPQDELPAASEAENSQKEMLQSMIHSRRFREYCTQVLSKEIDECCTTLLQELVRFQDRLYHKDPNKARLKRRFVLGLREVTKHLKVRRIKCVIISPNLERIQSKGGLDEALHNIIEMCQVQNIPFIFALSRKQLGKACCKVVPVSVVGIFSYEGAEEHFKKLRDLTEKARESYKDMVSNLAAELEELYKLYPGDMPRDQNVCDREMSENTSTSAACDNHANENASVSEMSKCLNALPSCQSLGGGEDQLSPVDLDKGLTQELTWKGEDSFVRKYDSVEGNHLTDEMKAEAGSRSCLEEEVREGGQFEDKSNAVVDSLCPSGAEFSLLNLTSS